MKQYNCEIALGQGGLRVSPLWLDTSALLCFILVLQDIFGVSFIFGVSVLTGEMQSSVLGTAHLSYIEGRPAPVISPFSCK